MLLVGPVEAAVLFVVIKEKHGKCPSSRGCRFQLSN